MTNVRVVNSIDGSSKPLLYRGEDWVDVFIHMIIEVKGEVVDKMEENKENMFNATHSRYFNTATKLFICGKDFQGDRRVRDHCHLTDIGDVPTMIVIHNLLCVFTKSQFSP